MSAGTPEKIDAKDVIPTGSVTKEETPYERRQRKRVELAYSTLPLLLLLIGMGFCAYLVLVKHEFMGQAFGVIAGIIGAISGMLFGSRKDNS